MVETHGGLMILMSLCTVACGAEIVSCMCEGLVWVRPDGTQVCEDNYSPAEAIGLVGPALIACSYPWFPDPLPG